MKVYCTKCGSRTEYSLKKPQFCSSCGTPFAQLSASAPRRVFKAAPAVASAPVVDEDEEEYEEDEYMISVPQVGFDDNVNIETQQEQLMESIYENLEGGFFVTSGIGSRGNNHNNNNNSKGMIPSSSAPQLGAKSKKSPYIVA